MRNVVGFKSGERKGGSVRPMRVTVRVKMGKCWVCGKANSAHGKDGGEGRSERKLEERQEMKLVLLSVSGCVFSERL